MFLECDLRLDTVDISEGSVRLSLSVCIELSSKSSSGIESTQKFCDDLVANGRMDDHGGDSFINAASSGFEDSVSHSSNFFATHAFCVHLNFEK